MKAWTRIVLTSLAALALAGPVRAAGWENIESLPGRAAETVTVKGKPRTYFRVTLRAPLAVTIVGPAQLRIISRAALAGTGAPVASYQLVALEGGTTLKASDEKAGKAWNVSAPNLTAMGEARRMTIDVPDGTHTIELRLTGTPVVLARLQRSAPVGAESWVSLTPIRAARSVSVIEGEKSIAYYTAIRGQPVALRVVGPTTLDLLARLDFDATMRGVQSYRLRLVEDGKLMREVEFRTTKAVTASYAKLSDRVPSKFDRLSLPVRSGLHEIEIHLVAPAGGAAELHARIPQPSIGNAE